MPFDRDGTPMQRSMLEDRLHYKTNGLSVNKKGIVLEVKYSDHSGNRSAQSKNDRRGWLHEAKVWLVEDCAILEHVIIPPNTPSGLDNYEECLPRASTKSVDGLEIDENLSIIDPNDLDGDWCIVSFLDGKMRDPYVSRWWPNTRNVFDPATSGKGNPKFGTSRGTAIDQRGRYFKRTNGIEHTITSEGNIIISTTHAGSKLKPGGQSSNGRFPRSTFNGGGSIITYIKPSQSLTLSWDEQVDGIGPDGLYEPSLPQKNPVMAPPKPTAITKTNIKVTSDDIKASAPVSLQIRTKKTAMLDAPKIYMGENATDNASMRVPTMANFNAIWACLNQICAVLGAPIPVTGSSVSGGPVTGTATVASPPTVPSGPQEVKTTKLFVE